MKILNYLHAGYVAVEYDGLERKPGYQCVRVVHIDDLPADLLNRYLKQQKIN